MHWTAPSEKVALTETLEKCLWDSADQFRASASGGMLLPSARHLADQCRQHRGWEATSPYLQ